MHERKWGFPGNCTCLGFLADKVVGDGKTFFTGWIQWSTNHTVHLGWSSSEGLDCVSNDFVDNPAKGDKNKKLIWVHAELVRYFRDINALPHHITASGWELHSNKVVSCWSQREYSISDIEHLICTLWVTVLRNNACRNISNMPNLSANHCHPLPSKSVKFMMKCWDQRWRLFYPFSSGDSTPLLTATHSNQLIQISLSKRHPLDP